MKFQLPPLIGGVSQLPDSRQEVANLRSCTNYLPDVVHGLCKRPGSFHVADLPAGNTNHTYLDWRAGEHEHYLVEVPFDGDVRVWDALNGKPLNVTVGPSAQAYLSGANPGDLEMVTIGTFNFILNRTKTVRKGTATQDGDLDWAFIRLEALLYATEYEVTIDGTSYRYTTPETGTLSEKDILSELQQRIPAQYNPVVFDNYILLGVKVDELESNFPVESYTSTLPSVDKLPAKGQAGLAVTVQPAVGEPYYLKWDTSQELWVEASKPGSVIELDSSTMPHRFFVLGDSIVIEAVTANTSLGTRSLLDVATEVRPNSVRGAYYLGQVFPAGDVYLRVEAIDTEARATSLSVIRSGPGHTPNEVVTAVNGDSFVITELGDVDLEAPPFATERWIVRSAGDDTTNPFPSFVDKPVTGISYFANRLVFLSGDNVVASKAADPLNWFASSGVQVQEDDPVDLNAGSPMPLTFRHAREYRGQLICIGLEMQYALVGREGLFGPSTAQLIVSGRLRSNTIVPPADKEDSWMVLQDAPSGTRLIEYYPNSDRDPNLAAPLDLTLQVPTYIPRGVVDIGVDPDLQMLAVLSQNDDTKVYLFVWKESGRERIQGAWIDFQMPRRINRLYFADQKLFLLYVDGQLVQLDPSIFNPSGFLKYQGKRFNPRLDDMTPNPATAQDVNSLQTFVTVPDDEVVVMNLRTGEVNSRRDDAGRVVVEGLVSNRDLIVGRPYGAVATLPDLYPRVEFSRQPEDTCKVQRVEVMTDGSTGLEATVEKPGRPSYRYSLSQYTPINYNLGELNMTRHYRHRFAVMGQSDNVTITLEAPSPLHTAINQVAWEGTVNMKQRRS